MVALVLEESGYSPDVGDFVTLLALQKRTLGAQVVVNTDGIQLQEFFQLAVVA